MWRRVSAEQFDHMLEAQPYLEGYTADYFDPPMRYIWNTKRFVGEEKLAIEQTAFAKIVMAYEGDTNKYEYYVRENK